MTSGEDMSGMAAAARLRAAGARERARRAEAVAERQDILAAQTGRDMYTQMARWHRRTAACHRSTARLQDTYARRLAGWAEGDGARPLFMSGVAEACGSDSAAVTLVGADHSQLSFAASDERSEAAQDMEYVLGEGPSRDSSIGRCLVLASGSGLEARWPGYGPAVAGLGITTVISAPLQISGSCIGALAVFDPRPEAVVSGTIMTMADALTRTVLLGPDADPELYGGADHREAVHQAAGMVSAQAHCPVPDALALIKARAFTEGLSTGVIARRVMHGDLRLT